MSNSKIEPALSDTEWVRVMVGNGLPHAPGSTILEELSNLVGREIPAAIAYLNHELPDSDGRKITRKHVQLLRATAEAIDGEFGTGKGDDGMAVAIGQIADVIESYLPREAAVQAYLDARHDALDVNRAADGVD